MMRGKKRTAVFLVLFFCISCFTGCHGSKGLNAFTVPEEFDMTGEYELVFWAKNDTNKVQTAIYDKAIADFEALYPNISVTIRSYTDYGKIYNDVITNIATNTTPNICISYPDHIATYMTGVNIVVPLNELMSDADYGLGGSKVLFDAPKKEEIIPQFLEECTIGDAYYALPFMRSSECCYVNKTYVEAMGYTIPDKLTWDFVWEVSAAAMAQDAEGNYLVNGQKVLIPFIYKSTDNMMIQMLKQKNAGYSKENGEILIFNEDTKEILRSVRELAEKKAFSTFKISSYPGNFFNAGQCLFAIDSTAGATWMGSEAPLSDISEEKVVNFDTLVMELPQYDTENPQMISQGPSVCIFNKEDPQEVMASWLFLQYLLTNEVQIAYSQTEGYVPVTEKAQKSEQYQEYLSRSGEDNDTYYSVKIDAAKLLLKNVGNTFVTPVFNGSASLRDASGQMIENVTKSVNRGQEVDEAYLEDLFDDMVSLYRLNIFGSENGGTTVGKQELGELPQTAVVLISCLAGAWILMLLYVGINKIKEQKKEKH